MDLTYSQGRKAYGDVGTNVRGKFGKVSVGISYRYKRDNRIIDDEDFRLIPEDGSEQKQEKNEIYCIYTFKN